MSQSNNYQYDYIKDIITTPKNSYVSDSVLRKISLRFVHSFFCRLPALIILAFICFSLRHADGFPKLIKVYTGHTVSGYTEGTGKVVDVNRNYGKYTSGCNVNVVIDGISADNSTPFHIQSVPCNVNVGNNIKLIYSDKEPSDVANIDPVDIETYADFRVVLLVLMVILELLRFFVAWGLINVGQKTVVNTKYTPLRLKLHKLSDKERSELTREIESPEDNEYLKERFLRGIQKCAVKDENSAFSCKMAGLVISSYCYAIKESELRKIAEKANQKLGIEPAENSGEDRNIYFLSPWKPRILKPAPFMDIWFGEKSASKYVMKPVKK